MEKEKQLVEFPVIIDGSNEVITLFLEEETAARASQDENFLRHILQQRTEDTSAIANSKNSQIDESNVKGFVWPDAAVLLLIEKYREKEYEFNTGKKKNNVIWGDIAAEIKETNGEYAVTGLQCSTKFAGLKRTYKNIYEQNKKSGNSHSSWGFYSAMDSLIGEKVYIQPPAEASSEGPLPPSYMPQSSSSLLLLHDDSQGAPKKRRVEYILENYIENIRQDRENMKKQRDEEKKKKEEDRAAKYQERKKEREKMHNDQMEIQKALLSVLQNLTNKK